MPVPNNTSRRLWTYETVPGTAEIVAVDTVTYKFGVDQSEDLSNFKEPTIEQPTLAQFVNAKRTANAVIYLKREYPTFIESFHPATMQFLSWILKKPNDGSPITIDVMDTKLNYPMTIRHEQSGGTNPSLKQAVGCYCINTIITGDMGKQLLTVDCEFVYQKIEDEGDRAHLTTDPLEAGALTKGIAFNAAPTVIYDVGGANLAIPEISIAQIVFTQNYKVVPDDIKNLTQTVYLYELNKMSIILTAPMQTSQFWDDLRDRVGTKELSITFYKPDGTTYIKFDFTNVMYNSHMTTKKDALGFFMTICALTAEDVQITGTKQVAVFATHYKGQVV